MLWERHRECFRASTRREARASAVAYRVLRGGSEVVIDGPPDVFSGGVDTGGTWIPVAR